MSIIMSKDGLAEVWMTGMMRTTMEGVIREMLSIGILIVKIVSEDGIIGDMQRLKIPVVPTIPESKMK